MDSYNISDRLSQISDEFMKCSRAITAIGDETRQKIIVVLLQSGCDGLRVGAITEKTHLSRPAVSHHLQVLKDANVINMRREGTMNYYFLDAENTQWKTMLDLMEHINDLVDEVTKNKICGGTKHGFMGSN